MKTFLIFLGDYTGEKITMDQVLGLPLAVKL
jgi:hypothetical protein